jgi:NTP pyrophosphatase (non-canonical NTP hydrolase)
MTHPLELQRRNMISYQQIDNQSNEIIIDGESQMPNYLSEKLLLEEYQEFLQATQENNQEKIADALGDILICTMGAGIEHGISLEYFPEHFQKTPFLIDDTYSKVDILKTVDIIKNNLYSKHATAQRLYLIWNTIIIEAKEHGFNIEGIYNAIAENNLSRIIYDENGKPKRNEETKKIMRKDMHPDLKPFIL